MRYDYDLVVIGGGAAGLVAATGGAALGAKTALIEKNKLGGDCTWYGCIPSKALLRSAQVLSLIRRCKDYGISGPGDQCYDTGAVMAHVRKVISEISAHHPARVFEQRGIKVLFGNPGFVDNRTIKLDGVTVTSRRFIICTGSHPMVPPIEGLENTGYLTNENIFDLESLPGSLAVLGGGPIGIEISQALSRLGVRVFIIEMLDRILFREDAEAARLLTDILEREGVTICAGKKAVMFHREGDLISITLQDKDGKKSAIRVEKVLVAVGRTAAVDGLNLERAGVEYTGEGIDADSTLRTSAGNIYVAGDVAGPYRFSHMAEYQAIIAVGNALFPFKRKVSYGTVPWCTFTDPELAHLGLTEEEAKLKYRDVKIYRSPYNENDRAVTDLKVAGFAKVICDKRGHILGAHIVGTNAGELIHEYVLARSAGLGIGKISSAIHVYPTLAQVVKRTADQYYAEMISSAWFRRMSKFFINLMR